MSMYFKTPNYSVAMNAKVASSTLARAIVRDFHPHEENLVQTAAYPEGKGPDTNLIHWMCPKESEPSQPVVLIVREPVERFRSAMAQTRLTDVDAALASLEEGTLIEMPRRAGDLRSNAHFARQSVFLETPLTAFRLEDLELAAGLIGIQLPMPLINEGSGEKPVLTADQEARVLAYYQEDSELYGLIPAGGSLEWTPLPVAPEPEPVPETVTATQIRLWLVRNGISMVQVSAAISAIENQQEKAEAEVLWEYAPYVERTNPLVAAIAGGFGMSDQAVDQAFREASAL